MPTFRTGLASRGT